MRRRDSTSPERGPSYYREQLELGVGIPFVDGNVVAVLSNGVEIFPAMLDAIAAAQRTIEFETFIYGKGDVADRFARALAERAEAGARVRVLLDSYGAKPISAQLLERWERAGVELRWFRPLASSRPWRADKRTHRKVLVCDDQVGFTGGVGIAAEWEGDAGGPGEWRDLHFRLDGPAVGGLRAAFLENWNESGPWTWDEEVRRPVARAGGVPVQVVRASATVGWTDIATLVRTLVAVARRELLVTTAYFVPDPQLVELLLTARRRGVEVRVLLPGRHTDSRLSQLAGMRSVERLLAGGVTFHRYEHTFLHAKWLTVDGQLSCVGSANLNHRSLGKDEECCAVVLDEGVAARLRRAFERDLLDASTLGLGQLRTRGAWSRAKEWAARRLVEHL